MLFFDLDGTLLDSNGIWHEVDRLFLEKRGFPHTAEYHAGVAHATLPQAAKFTREFCGIDEPEADIIAEWIAMAGDFYAHEVPLKPYAREFLQLCREHGQQMAVLTSAATEHCRSALKLHGLEEFFSHVICVQDLGLQKRQPETFRRAADITGHALSDCVLFDDSLQACRGAMEAGWRVIGVYDRFFDEDAEALQSFCHRFIRSFHELF